MKINYAEKITSNVERENLNRRKCLNTEEGKGYACRPSSLIG